MQRKDVQTEFGRDGLAPGVARTHRERRSRSFVADMEGIVSAAHELPSEVDPPARVWASLHARLEEEGILNQSVRRELRKRTRFPARERPEEAPPREEAPRQSEAKYQTLVDTIASAIFISRGKRLHYVNRAAEVITGYARKELLQMGFQDLIHPDTREPLTNFRRALGEEIGLTSRYEVRILTKNHQERWLDITATLIDFDLERSMLISAFDLTDRKRAEEQAQLLTITDPLTGLGNYRQIRDVLSAEIERSGRTRRPFAVLLLDLDGLKKINDRCGHLAGSRALCRLADVLRLSCRAIDKPRDTVATSLPSSCPRQLLVLQRLLPRASASSSQRTVSNRHSPQASESLFIRGMARRLKLCCKKQTVSCTG